VTSGLVRVVSACVLVRVVSASVLVRVGSDKWFGLGRE